MDLLAKFKGTMLGLAIGDALGAPLEGLKAGHIKELFGRVSGFVDPEAIFKPKPWRYIPKGVWTDDTQQALCLSESLVRCYGFNANDFIKTFLKLWEFDEEKQIRAFRRTGTVFKKVMEGYQSGMKAFKAGAPSAGIGAGMRVAPVGLYFYEDKELLVKSAIEQALITHTDPRAIALSGTVAWIVGNVLDEEWERQKLKDKIEQLIDGVFEIEKKIETDYIAYLPARVYDYFGLFYKSVVAFKHWQGMEKELVYQQIVNLANQAFPRQKITSPAQNFALACGITSVFLGLTSSDFETGMIEAINLGRDADSLGAMTGAILGARFGEEGIPVEWRESLKDAEQICLWACALYQKGFNGLKLRNLVELEKELTEFVVKEQEKFYERMVSKGEFVPKTETKKAESKISKLDKAQIKFLKGKKKYKIKREKSPWRRWED